MENSKLDDLKVERSKLEDSINILKNDLEDFKKGKKKCSVNICKESLEMLKKYQEELEDLLVRAFAANEVEDGFDWEDLKTLLNSVTDQFENLEVELIEFKEELPRIKVPPLNLPTFDGTREHYEGFIEGFRKLVDNNNSLIDYNKFYLLRTCLQGEAAKSIAHIPCDSCNYKIALARLEEDFNDKVETFRELVKKLLSRPARSCESTDEVRQMCDEKRTVISLLESMATNEDIFNAIVERVVLSALDDQFLKRWLEKNDHKSLPSWKNCLKILDDYCALLRFNRFSDNFVESPDPPKTTFARSLSCVFCNEESHNIASCDSFKALNVNDRRKNALRSNLCFNCLSANHKCFRCKRKIRCDICKKKHHTLLHIDE